MFDQDALAQYEQNLAHLIKDLRAHLKQPNLPVVVGELGNMGEDAGKNMKVIREAQRKACERKEWKGRVSFVKTTAFARPKDESPNVGHGHHWFGNAESYFLIGDAWGRRWYAFSRTKEIGSRRRLEMISRPSYRIRRLFLPWPGELFQPVTKSRRLARSSSVSFATRLFWPPVP